MHFGGAKDTLKNNSEYMLQRYHDRRNEAIEKLGGKCAVCGSEDDLQIDHIFREDKEFPIGQLWSVSKERYEKELTKCQLLCRDCHKAKNQWERGRKAAIRTHGTLSSYRYCKCNLCKKAYSDYWQKYSKKNPRPSRAQKIATAPGIYVKN